MNPLGGMFQEPEQKRTFGQKAMNVVRNFGAGLAGFGPEFIAMQRQEQQQLDEQRQKAMAKDAMTVYQLLNDNKIDDAISLVDRRVQYISELGGDPSDTLEIRQMLTTPGRLDEARQELGLFVQASMENGLLPAPRVPEQFTLGADEVRYDDQGNVVARGVTKPAEQQGPLTDIAKLRADLAAGRITQADFDSSMADRQRGGAPSARDAEISDLMQTFGMSRQEAITALSARTMIDPTTGNVVRYDPLTSSASLPTINVPDQEVNVQRPQNRVEESDLAFDPGKGTGFASSFLGLWNSTVGQIPFVPISTERSQAAQNLRILERDAINALASSSRPAVVEQERIIQALPRAMEWFENPDDARMKMTSFVDLMTNQYVDDLRYSSNLTNPRQLREESARRASEVERIMGRVLTPEAASTMLKSINRIETEIGDVSAMSDTQLLSIDPSQMTDVQLDAYIERLKNGGR